VNTYADYGGVETIHVTSLRRTQAYLRSTFASLTGKQTKFKFHLLVFAQRVQTNVAGWITDL